jgi:catechol 2,3-dioxygenase-like lactoylglutathione lyase family enzyme
MIRRLAHVSFDTDDLARFTKFYTEVLGLPVKITFRNKEGEVFGYYLDCGETSFIEVFDRQLKVKQWGGELRPPRQGSQYSHLSLEVVGIEETKAALEAGGLKVGPINEGLCGARTAWFSDPDGNAIELMEYTSGSRQLARGTHTV